MKDNTSYTTSIGEKYTIIANGEATEATIANRFNGYLDIIFSNSKGETITAKTSEYSLFSYAKQYCDLACCNELEQMAILMNSDAGTVEEEIRYCGHDMPEEVATHMNKLYELREQGEKFRREIKAIEEQHNEKERTEKEKEEKPLRHIWQSVKAFAASAATCIMTSYILALLLPLIYLNNFWWIIAIAAIIIPLFIRAMHKTIAMIPDMASVFIRQYKMRAIPSVVLFAANAAWLIFLCFGTEYYRLNSTQIFTSIVNAITIIIIYSKYIENITNYENSDCCKFDRLEYFAYTTPAHA